MFTTFKMARAKIPGSRLPQIQSASIQSFQARNVFPFVLSKADGGLLLKYQIPFVTIRIAYGNAPTPIRRGCGGRGQLLARGRGMPCLAALVEPADSETRRRTGSTPL